MANYEVKLKDGSNYLFPQGMAHGIDTSNILTSGYNSTATTFTYTATQDCFVSINSYGVLATLTIDGQTLHAGLPYTNGPARCMTFLKKSQTFVAKCNTGNLNYYVFGLKY